MRNYIASIIDESVQVHNKLRADEVQQDVLVDFSTEIAKSFVSGGKLYLFGNGGSAGDSQHIAAEFVNRFVMERPPLPAIALTTDTSLLTAVGNDFTFDSIFEKQVSALVSSNDIVWGFSTSGNSENVIRGLTKAAKTGARVVGFTGGNGGKMKGICDNIFIADSKITARVQEIHILAAHIICGLVDEIMFGRFSK